MGQDIPPIPHMTAITDQFGRLTPTWADWFKKAAARMGGNNSLSNAELATRQIGTSLIQDSAITTAKLADNSVTTAKIVDANVTGAKLTDNTIPFVKLLAADWGKSLTSNGYQRLGSGLEIQWGVTSAILTGANATISFPATFSNGCLQVIASPQHNPTATGAETGHWSVDSFSTTSFKLYNLTSINYVFYWFAVGY